MMAEVVYSLCALTSIACAILLLRGWARSRVRLLAWSSIAFVGLALNNIGLVLDFMVFTTDLSVWRTIPATVGMLILVCALAWENL